MSDINLWDLGGKGDGTNESAILTAAIATGQQIFIPYMRKDLSGPATWYFPAQYNLTSPVVIVGDKRKPLVKQGGAPLFVIRSNHCVIENIMFDQSAQTSELHCTIIFDTNFSHSIKGTRIRHCHFGIGQDLSTILGGYRSIADNGGTIVVNSTTVNTEIVDANISDLVIWGAKSCPLYFTRFHASVYLDQITVDFTRNTTTAINYAGLYINGVGPGGEADPGGYGTAGVNMTYVAVQGAGNGTKAAGGNGFEIKNAFAVDMTLCRADGCAGNGFVFKNLIGCQFTNLVGSQCDLNQYYLTGLNRCTFTSPFAGGCRGKTGASSSQDGFGVLGGCSRLIVTGLRVIDATGRGLRVNDSNSNQFVGLNISDCLGNGFEETGTSNYNIFGAGFTDANGPYNGVVKGSGTIVENIIRASGVAANSATSPPAVAITVPASF
ncbi:hypothetical protein [Asticcacaulis benevestitus]|uniref:hypothetical protein n=1 Tax=Asticcacaulis benevestitus TaxID=347481 RepID=UPI00039A009C|nr:hypothetical protein [Asticcacaulis benevestitus]